MAISKLPAFRPSKHHLKIVVVAGLCAVFQTIGTDAHSTWFSSSMIQEYEVAEIFIPRHYIKRLMPIDPESTEAMLAGRGLDSLDPSITLS